MKKHIIGAAMIAAIGGLAMGVLAGGGGGMPGGAPGGMPGGAGRGGTSVTGTTTAPLAAGESRVTSPAVGKTAGQSRRAGGDPVDDRVEIREYSFKDTGENMPYAVFVSSKVTKDKKAPLVLALHGMGGNFGTFMRTAVVDEAEKGGYILVGPMGYSPSGPFGMNFGGGRGGPGRGAPGRGAPATGPASAPASRPAGAMIPSSENGPFLVGAPAAPGGAAGGASGGGRAGAMGGGMPGGRGGPALGGTKETDSAKVAELSEKDAIYVLEMACKEYNVDPNRIYLMGHSLGGGGSLHMGEKYADKWAAVAALAPAAFGFTWTAESKLKNVPLLIAQGEADTMVQPAGSQRLADQLKAFNFKSEIIMMPGLDHGGIIAGAQPEVFKFFEKHVKPESK
jgi:predicted esterase